MKHEFSAEVLSIFTSKISHGHTLLSTPAYGCPGFTGGEEQMPQNWDLFITKSYRRVFRRVLMGFGFFN